MADFLVYDRRWGPLIRHPIFPPLSYTVQDGLCAAFADDVKICETRLPALVCTCRRYILEPATSE